MNSQIEKKTLAVVNSAIDNNPAMKSALANKGITSIDKSNFSAIEDTFGTLSYDAQNTWYTDLDNKIVLQIVQDLDNTSKIRKLLDTFSIGKITPGIGIEILTGDIVTPEDVSLADGGVQWNWTIKKNKVYSYTIGLSGLKTFQITFVPSQVRKAMVSPQALATFLASNTRKLVQSVDLYYWNLLKSDIVNFKQGNKPDGTPLPAGMKVENIGTGASTSNDLFEKITAMMYKWEFPTKDYNEGVWYKPEGGVAAQTPKQQIHQMEDLVLVLNPTVKAKFEVQTFASLFHPDKLQGRKLKVIMLPFTDENGAPIVNADKTIGFLYAKSRIKFGWGTKEFRTQVVARGGFLNHFANTEVAFGQVPNVNAVKLMIT